jgi:hypothetical protein
MFMPFGKGLASNAQSLFPETEAKSDGRVGATLRIAMRAEHADEAFHRRAGGLAQLFEAHGRPDVIAQNRLAGVHVTGEHRVDTFAQECGAKRGIFRHAALDQFGIVGGAVLHQFIEAFRQWHPLPSFRPAPTKGAPQCR